MALYMTQFSYTTEAIMAMAKNPQDRSVGFKKILEKLDGQLIGEYFCFGEYDGVAIVEIPDNVTELALLMAVTAAGHVKALKTTLLLSMKDTVKAMKKASELNYKGPEG
jgi:uncharacterized protein with GYD domain